MWIWKTSTSPMFPFTLWARNSYPCTLCICRRLETDPIFSHNPAISQNTMKTRQRIMKSRPPIWKMNSLRSSLRKQKSTSVFLMCGAAAARKAKLFTPQREAIGTCPRCGAAVYEGKKNYYCSDRACSFVMWKNDLFFQQRKKTFTKAIAAALLKDGKVKIKGMYSTKTGKTFDGVVLLADTGGKYVNFRVEQNRK